MGIVEMLHRHFSVANVHRTAAAVERDMYLEFPPPITIGRMVIKGGWIYRCGFNRWLLLPAAVVIQMCIGTFYAWSGYNEFVDKALTGDNQAGLSPNAFYIAIACFGPCAAVFGPWVERAGPRSGILLGALMYFIANVCAAFACNLKQVWLLYAGYGVVGGCGLGIAYISPVPPLQKWFPDWRGLSSGCAVAGFGLGSFAASFAQNSLIESVGIERTFWYLGFIYLCVMVILTPIIRVPPITFTVNGVGIDTIRGTENLARRKPRDQTSMSGDVSAPEAALRVGRHGDVEEGNGPGADARLVDQHDRAPSNGNGNGDLHKGFRVDVPAHRSPLSLFYAVSLEDALFSWEFLMMFVMLFCNGIFGLTTASKLQDMVKFQFGKSTDESSVVNAIFAIFSTLGRIVIPLLSDKFGRKGIYLLTLALQIAVCALLPTVFDQQVYWAFLICIFVMVSCYGGGYGAIPAFLSDMFGARNVGPLHGVIVCTWSLGGMIGIAYNNILNSQQQTLGKDNKDIYNYNLRWILPVICFGLILTTFIKTNIRDRVLPRLAGEFWRSRISGRLTIFTIYGIKSFSKEVEDKLWSDFLEQHGY